jgi:quinol monooxygenase YgiN
MKTITFKAIGICMGIILWCNMQAKTQDVPVAKLTRFELKQTYQGQFKNVISKYVKKALLDQDNIMAEAYYEKENPSVIWLIERWNDRKGLKKFDKTIEASAKIALTKPVQVYFVKDLEPLSKLQWRKTAKTLDQPITIMLFVNAKKGTQQDFKNIYHQAMPQFRSEPGVVTYQLSEIEGDDTQFVTYEKFRSEEAFQYHLKFPPIQPVIDYLNTSIKRPPFQNGIHNLIEFAPLKREK